MHTGLTYRRWLSRVMAALLFSGLALSLPAQSLQRQHFTIDTNSKQAIRAQLNKLIAVSQRGVKVEIMVITSDERALLQRLKNTTESDFEVRSILPGCVGLAVNIDLIHTLEKWPEISFMSLVAQVKPELKNEGFDFTLNDITWLHHQRPALDGEGYALSIKEHQFNTTDIDFKNRILPSANASAVQDQHATVVASLAAGGGNSDPSAKGVAWHAGLTSADFINMVPDADSIYTGSNIGVQNHAYGSGEPENYYGAEAMAFDAACIRLPEVLHVFSSGNIGQAAASTPFPYHGLEGWANLSGNYKQSKNTISVGAVDSLKQVQPYSSGGPAYDGRIKPEVMAYGKDGTSNAAAIVSGITVLMQQAYDTMLTGELPPASLLRAALVNTAEDMHTPGPDFRSGYGIAKAFDAVSLLEEKRYAINELQEEEEFVLPLQIGNGMRQLRVTIAWHDPPAALFATRALVHDLDLYVVRESDQQVFRPFVLNHFPHQDSLSMAATTGIDTLNNIEHVVIDFPHEGEYIIHVVGKQLAGFQPYSVVWSVDTIDKFIWNYPTASDILEAANHTALRWESDVQVDGELEYKYAGDQTWTSIDSINTSSKYLGWNVPNRNGLLQFRFRTPVENFITDTIVVSSQPKMRVAYVCGDSTLLTWNTVANADQYIVQALGDQHLFDYVTTADTVLHIKHPFVSTHFAVTPVIDHHQGRRSPAIAHQDQGAGCYINYFFLHHIEGDIAFFQADIGYLEGIAGLRLQRLTETGFATQSFVLPVDSNIILVPSQRLSQGRNVFRLALDFHAGKTLFSDTVVVYFAVDHELIVYPSPARSGSAVQVLVRRPDVFDLAIYDLHGKLIAEFVAPTIPVEIKMPVVPAGMYYMVAKFENGEVDAGKFSIIR